MILLGIAAESGGDARHITHLTDRIILEGAHWITPEVLDAYRRWGGVEGEADLDMHSAYVRARARKLPVYGHFSGEPGSEDAASVRAALMLFAEDERRPDAVIIARDMDDRPARADGFAEASADRAWPFAVIGALATPELEAWRVAAVQTESPEDQIAWDQVRQRIGFDPTLYPERLTSKHLIDKRDAKRILTDLTSSGRSPDDRWSDVPLSRLRERGGSCGLRVFMDGVQTHIVNRLTGAGPP